MAEKKCLQKKRAEGRFMAGMEEVAEQEVQQNQEMVDRHFVSDRDTSNDYPVAAE